MTSCSRQREEEDVDEKKSEIKWGQVALATGVGLAVGALLTYAALELADYVRSGEELKALEKDGRVTLALDKDKGIILA
jgi:hypothetical protein